MDHFFPVTLTVYHPVRTQELTMLGQFLQLPVNVFVLLFAELLHRTSCHQNVLLTDIYIFIGLQSFYQHQR